jgi:acyl-CoA thioester hydrolase
MQSFHMSAFRVRQYECDAYGHLNNVNYVRYLGEAGLETGAAGGYDLAHCVATGRRWQMRRLDIEYLLPSRYGDTVEVHVSAPAIEATTVRRAYQFRLAGSGDLVAQACTESVFLDNNTGERVSIPTGAIEIPADPVDLPPPIEDVPPSPSPPPGVFSVRRRVTWGDLDMTRHVGDATLLEYVEVCGFGVIAAHGWPAARMAAQGFAIILRRHQIENLMPAALDGELEIATWASNVKRATATRHYTIRRVCDGALLTRVDTLGVWVDLATGRPIRIPPDFLADFAPNLVA